MQEDRLTVPESTSLSSLASVAPTALSSSVAFFPGKLRFGSSLSFTLYSLEEAFHKKRLSNFLAQHLLSFYNT
jgi:hypothetical protein